MDLVAFAVPLRLLPAVVSKIGRSIGERATLLFPARGELRSHAELPARYAAERTGASTIALVGVPAGVHSLLNGAARVELACEDADRRRQLESVLAEAEVSVGPPDAEPATPARRVA